MIFWSFHATMPESLPLDTEFRFQIFISEYINLIVVGGEFSYQSSDSMIINI